MFGFSWGNPAVLGALVVVVPLAALFVYLFNRHQTKKPVSARMGTVLVALFMVAVVVLLYFLEKL